MADHEKRQAKSCAGRFVERIYEPWDRGLGEGGAGELFWRMTRCMLMNSHNFKKWCLAAARGEFSLRFLCATSRKVIVTFFRMLQEAMLKIELSSRRNAQIERKSSIEVLGTTPWKVMRGGAGIPIKAV